MENFLHVVPEGLERGFWLSSTKTVDIALLKFVVNLAGDTMVPGHFMLEAALGVAFHTFDDWLIISAFVKPSRVACKAPYEIWMLGNFCSKSQGFVTEHVNRHIWIGGTILLTV